MSLESVPEQRWAGLLDLVGAFGPDLSGVTYQKQIGFFDEDRIPNDGRALFIKRENSNYVNGDFHDNIDILMVFVSKKDKSDSIEVSQWVNEVRHSLSKITEYEDIFGIVYNGINGPFILESGRHVFELRFRMLSSYCPDQ